MNKYLKMNISELNLTSNALTIIEFLQSKNLLNRNNKCNKCNKKSKKKGNNKMKLAFRFNRGKPNHYWRCPKCGKSASIKKGSIFESYKISVVILAKIIIHWVLNTSYVKMEKLLNVSRQFASDFCQIIRVLVALDYDRERVMLGGNGQIIEIDESLFAKVKHNKGKDLKRKTVWVFGMRERDSNKCYFEIVPDRERTTLLSIIFKHVRPHSIMYSDSWSSYGDIARLEFQVTF